MSALVAALALVLASACNAAAHEPTGDVEAAPRAKPRRDEPAAAAARGSRLALHAARLIDVEQGVAREHAWLAIEGDRIVAVAFGAAARESLGDVAQVVELGDATLVPGLIDCHVHLTSTLEGDYVDRAVHESPIDAALRGVAHARVTLEAGFTTVRNCGAEGFSDVALARAIERGDVVGPTIVPCGHGIGITGGHADETGFRPGVLVGGTDQGIADGADECRKAVRAQIKYGARAIKCVATAGVLSFEESVGAQQMTEEELAAVVDEARRHGLKVAAHAHGTDGILAAVRAGVASIEHGSMLDARCIEAMLAHGTYLVPTAYLRSAIDLDNLAPMQARKAREVFPLADASLALAIRSGVKIAYGTDAGVYRHGENAREFAVLVEAGLTPIEALRSATIAAADLLDLDDRGTLEAGMRADVVAVDGDPLSDVRALERAVFVMRAGEIVKRPR